MSRSLFVVLLALLLAVGPVAAAPNDGGPVVIKEGQTLTLTYSARGSSLGSASVYVGRWSFWCYYGIVSSGLSSRGISVYPKRVGGKCQATIWWSSPWLQ